MADILILLAVLACLYFVFWLGVYFGEHGIIKTWRPKW